MVVIKRTSDFEVLIDKNLKCRDCLVVLFLLYLVAYALIHMILCIFINMCVFTHFCDIESQGITLSMFSNMQFLENVLRNKVLWYSQLITIRAEKTDLQPVTSSAKH